MICILMWARLLELAEKYPLDFLSHLSSSLPIILGTMAYKYLRRPETYVGLFFIFCFVKDTYWLFLILFSKNTLYVQNIESFFETALVGLIYYYCFDSLQARRNIIILTTLCLMSTLYEYSGTQVSSISLSAFRLLSIGLCLAYFNKVLTDMHVKNIVQHTMFWFTAGLLIYSTGTFFIMLFSEYWYKDINKVAPEVFDRYWNANQILFIIFCCFSGVGMYMSKLDRENYI